MTTITVKPFQEAAEEWIRHLEQRDGGMTIKPRRSAGHIRNHLMKHLAERAVCDLREIDLHRLSWSLAALGSALAGSVMTTLRKFLDYAETRNWIAAENNPSKAKIPWVSAVSKRFATAPDRRNQWLAMPSRTQLILMVTRSEGMAGTALRLFILAGLRGNEARALKCAKFAFHADEPDGTGYRLNIEDAFCSQHRDPFVPKGTKTFLGERYVHLGIELSEHLVDITAGRSGDEYILHRDGIPLTSEELDELIRQEQVRLGIGRRVLRSRGGHSYPGTYGMRHLRHAFVALLIFDGWEDEDISTVVGHGSTTVTLDIYGYLFNLRKSGWETWPSDGDPDNDPDTDAMELAYDSR
ncbi:hypothetical protein [Pelagibacterium sp. H642]|uniref:hypothetical protein n=1 Tax=Pelagibacterium sp. H642 TaxID=1881069 RepID=UPI0028169ABB|nr:hypothetical protein [Pelagibacterium sp. H642]WMT91914.1 hypothetical protein NO934_06540 [Pelagibacterium sp. H642]